MSYSPYSNNFAHPNFNANYIFLSDEIQLGYALDAFAWAHHKPNGWATANLLRLKSAGIQSMSDLSMGCHENTIDLDLELFGIPPRQRLSRETCAALRSFLPGPVGFRCFRLAQMAANKVSVGLATTEYVHRPESGKLGEESFKIREGMWILHVDCAGFVRNCVKHTTKDPMLKCLSDRDFMRAKDFYTFFQTLRSTVMDFVVPSIEEQVVDGSVGEQQQIPPGQQRQWRRVDDLRMVIPGDIICYRPRGNAAGGAAFTTNDRKDLIHLLRAVKTSELWHDATAEAAAIAAASSSPDQAPVLLSRNFAKDPVGRDWVLETKQHLNTVGIRTVKDLYLNLHQVNELLQKQGLPLQLSERTLRLCRECAETTAQNTGHIVFCSGPAVDKGNGQYRIRVVHSTKYGRKDENGVVTQGVQEYFRRFERITDADGNVYWTREMSKAQPLECTITNLPKIESSSPPPSPKAAVSDDEDDNPNDDMEEDPDEVTVGEPVDEDEPDDLSGQAFVEVIAARMCF